MRLCRCHLSHISRPSRGVSAVKDVNQRSMKWISPVVDVLYMFSGTLGGVAGLAFPEQGQSLLDNEDGPLHKMTCGKYWSREDGVRVAWLLLERGMDVNRIRNDQCTPLHVAQAQFHGVHIAQLLPERDSDVSARGKDKWTPSHAASYYGRPEIVRLLLDRGAEANFRVVNTNPKKMASALHD
ncbi:ankyrin repeat-containing domain protein [Lactarius hengduanensis]|nr:ankyrin repeat-containing domain protein [Lactarius hengduanensis]